MLDKLIALDTQLFTWLNSHHSLFGDKLMMFISGKVEWLPLYLAIVGYIIYKYRWKSIYVFVAVVLLVTLSDQISTGIFKEGFKRLRPSHTDMLKDTIHLVNNYSGGQYGFVSSHATNSFALAMFLSFLFQRRWFSWFIFLWAITVSYSRIYLGVHYPGDILGGAILGLGIGSAIYYFYIFALKKLEARKLNK